MADTVEPHQGVDRMADNTLSCQRETLHSQQLRSIKKMH